MNHPETYGEEWRRRAREGTRLTSGERAAWAEELEWADDCEVECEALDSLVGTMVTTSRRLDRVNGDTISAGARLFARSRLRDRLLCESAVLGLLLLKLGWLVEGRAALDEARRVVA